MNEINTEALRRRFATMSAERDKEERSITEGRGRVVPGGYVTEITSRSPTSLSDGLETTTTRHIHTKSEGTVGRTTPLTREIKLTQDISIPVERPLPSAAFQTPVHRQPRPVFREPKSVSPTPSTTSSVRSVGFGGITTRVVEPSRLSPLRVEEVYAPVKYVTRRELRRMKKLDDSPGHDLTSKIRSTSVPRLDESKIHTGREFSGHSARGSPAAHSNSTPNWQRHGTPRSTTPQNIPRSVDGVTLKWVGAFLASIRGSKAPDPPAFAEEAFRVLNRGTYLIKYGDRGPHERFVSIRLVHDDNGGILGPYLCWQLHAESASVSERLHLGHLEAVFEGTTSFGFRRHLRADGSLQGPHVGQHRSNLPIDGAFSLVFRSRSVARSVDLLALDEQTRRCWLLVAGYVVNANAGSMLATADLESISPSSCATSS